MRCNPQSIELPLWDFISPNTLPRKMGAIEMGGGGGGGGWGGTLNVLLLEGTDKFILIVSSQVKRVQ
jgi:hypothetical protein